MSPIEIEYIEGDATEPKGSAPCIIVHVCNDIGGWGKGFVVAISKRWSEPEAHFRAWYANPTDDRPFELGEVQFVEVEPKLWVANLIGQRGIKRGNSNQHPVRYDAIRKGLERVGVFAIEKNASVHMPRIGCGLAGGKWEEVETLVEATLIEQAVPVTVYDFG